jgi:cytochrome c oxidase subunit 4
MASHHDHSHDHQSDVPEVHVGSKLVYLGVFTALLVGTALTVFAAFQDLGVFNAPIALAIATAKAVLVILFFMHVKESSKLTKTTVIAGAFWLGILFVLTMGDYVSRIWH